MPAFTYSFTVNAPLSAVSAFHHDTRVLKKLSPPPIFVQIHQFEPLSENSQAQFTLWVGPIPLRWQTIHTQVGPAGFTDTQLRGPLKQWQHTHRFSAVSTSQTLVNERIVYEHNNGFKGVITRLLFNKPALWLLFTYRMWATRAGVNGK